MPTDPKKPLIVISYAHEDEPETPAEGEVKWLSFVTGYLRPAVKHGAVDLWLDRLISGGGEWEREIEQKLHICDIFLLLVSRHSLSSDYVVDKEIALLRERQAQGEAVHFYPLVLTPTPKIALDLVRNKNLRPPDGKSLSDYGINQRYREMSDVANELAALTRKSVEFVDADSFAHKIKPRPNISVQKSVEDWVRTNSPSVLGLVARTALRVAPLVIRARIERDGQVSDSQFIDLLSAVFRSNALVWVASRYPPRTPNLGSSTRAAGAAIRGARSAIFGRSGSLLQGLKTSASDAATSGARAGDAASRKAGRVDSALGAVRVAANAAARLAPREVIWQQVGDDIATVEQFGTDPVAIDLPLWTGDAPNWAKDAWASIQETLPKDEDWRVWIDWYEERLHGGSRSEAYELVFASVPQEEWDKGPAAANGWIKDHLPKTPEAVRRVELPTPVSNLDAPFAYGWTASQRVSVVAGAQNLPFYPHFSSEEDHRQALEAARIGGERLLKALRDGRYNARPEYGEALQYYLKDLPKTAGAGNILLANDQVRILHAMFLADAAMLPEGFASQLKSVIANQFALNAFYDLVQRHNDAVSAGNWTRPFPLDAAKSFFGVVEDNTPRWFERDVEQGLRQVEQAEPPPATPPELSSAPVGPPPLPPGTPDAQYSWKRQMATAANALWETFLQGRNMPVPQDEWRTAADELGDHVRPIIQFLREQEERKG